MRWVAGAAVALGAITHVQQLVPFRALAEASNDLHHAHKLHNGAVRNTVTKPPDARSDTDSEAVQGAVNNNTNQAAKQLKQQVDYPNKAVKSFQEGTHFTVLASDGSPSRLGSIAADMQHVDVVLLGEYHDDPVAHALQLELLKRAVEHSGLAASAGPSPAARAGRNPTATAAADGDGDNQLQHSSAQQSSAAAESAIHPSPSSPQQSETNKQRNQQQRQVILSLEMFERDVQPVVDEYLAGILPLHDLLRDSRPWANYVTDYKPLVEFCKVHQLPVLAANAPRRYVSLAGRSSREALQQLPAAAKAWLAPLPYAQPSQAYIDKVQHSMLEAARAIRLHRLQEQTNLGAMQQQQQVSQQWQSPKQPPELQQQRDQQQHRYQQQQQADQQLKYSSEQSRVGAVQRQLGPVRHQGGLHYAAAADVTAGAGFSQRVGKPSGKH
eukprot:GHRR01001738.1.p1 GENE.GHRR01001738.1~~GHRR01001738.1.p1  ORF type:complete len:440 (+),score=183.63 GHRR01001738.1:170-1489(+)